MKTKIILEMGCNHQGDINLAKRMIDDAKKLGVWGVKFQKRDIDSIPENIKIKKRSLHNSFGETYYEHRKILEFSIDEIKELKEYTEKQGLEFLCSAFDIISIQQLDKIKCKYIKLPSQFFSNEEMIQTLNECKNDPIKIGSTGMHTEFEVYEYFDNFDIVFHCNSVYPHSIYETYIMVIIRLSKMTQESWPERCIEIGYSSHDENGESIKYAINAGAKYIERHYTLNKTMKGSDHSTVSSDFEEIKNIISQIKYIEKILGTGKVKLSKKEKITRKIYRGF